MENSRTEELSVLSKTFLILFIFSLVSLCFTINYALSHERQTEKWWDSFDKEREIVISQRKEISELKDRNTQLSLWLSTELKKEKK